jgi:hypothetical protein
VTVKTMRTPIAALVAFAALALAACGGSTNSSSSSGGGSIPETAAFTPSASAFFVSLDTDTSGDQWHKAGVLLDRFPSSDKLIEEFNKDSQKDGVTWAQVKATLGPETGIAGLTTDGSSVVMFTKSPKPDDLQALMKKGDDPMVSKVVDGWVVAGDTMAAVDRFTAAQSNGSLADDSAFKDAVGHVDADGIALAYVPGRTITTAFAKGLSQEGAPAGLGQLGDLGKIDSVAASATAQDDGASFDIALKSPNVPSTEPFSPTLDETLPAKPLLYVNGAHVDKVLRQVLDQVQKSVPNFQQQRAQIERALGLTLEGDVLPLFKGELGVGVYGEASGEIPVTIDAVLTVSDEDKATKLMDRLGALVQLGGNGSTAKVQVGDVQATELKISGEYSVFWVVDDGKLELSTSKAGLEKLRGSDNRLADDSAYTSQLSAADVPDQVTGLVYADLQTAVPFVLGFAGDAADAEVRENLKPLRSIVASGTTDDGTTILSGFVGIG